MRQVRGGLILVFEKHMFLEGMPLTLESFANYFTNG